MQRDPNDTDGKLIAENALERLRSLGRTDDQRLEDATVLARHKDQLSVSSAHFLDQYPEDSRLKYFLRQAQLMIDAGSGSERGSALPADESRRQVGLHSPFAADAGPAPAGNTNAGNRRINRTFGNTSSPFFGLPSPFATDTGPTPAGNISPGNGQITRTFGNTSSLFFGLPSPFATDAGPTPAGHTNAGNGQITRRFDMEGAKAAFNRLMTADVVDDADTLKAVRNLAEACQPLADGEKPELFDNKPLGAKDQSRLDAELARYPEWETAFREATGSGSTRMFDRGERDDRGRG